MGATGVVPDIPPERHGAKGQALRLGAPVYDTPGCVGATHRAFFVSGQPSYAQNAYPFHSFHEHLLRCSMQIGGPWWLVGPRREIRLVPWAYPGVGLLGVQRYIRR